MIDAQAQQNKRVRQCLACFEPYHIPYLLGSKLAGQRTVYRNAAVLITLVLIVLTNDFWVTKEYTLRGGLNSFGGEKRQQQQQQQRQSPLQQPVPHDNQQQENVSEAVVEHRSHTALINGSTSAIHSSPGGVVVGGGDLPRPRMTARGTNSSTSTSIMKDATARLSEKAMADASTNPSPMTTTNRTRIVLQMNLTRAATTTTTATRNERRHQLMQLLAKSNSTPCFRLGTNATVIEDLSFGACCGLGHRLTFNLRTLVYASLHGKHAYAAWTDVRWGDLFRDTDLVSEAPRVRNNSSAHQVCNEHYPNGFPNDWAGPGVRNESPRRRSPHDVYDQFGPPYWQLFAHAIARQVVERLRDSLSAQVTKRMHNIRHPITDETRGGPIRNHRLHLCAHFRLGNDETGDWQNKKWRHVTDPNELMNWTLSSMMDWVQQHPNGGGADNNNTTAAVSIFVAGDSSSLWPWFRAHVPSHWEVVGMKSGHASSNVTAGSDGDDETVGLPAEGVWFGQYGSNKVQRLGAELRTRVMAEAVADMFALGECSVLFVPTYSSFAVVPIMLSYIRGVPVMFRREMSFAQIAS